MKLLKIAIKAYSQAAKVNEARKTALNYYLLSRDGVTDLWAALYNDTPVGRKIYKEVASYIHDLSPRCEYCQDRIFHNKNANIEHILPASIYPKFTFIESNLVRACVTCNMLKGTDDFYAPLAFAAGAYASNSPHWKCYHPRHHVFSDHVERLIIQTNHLHFRAYLGKTAQGVNICSSLLSKVSEFEVKATANPSVAKAALNLSQFVQANGQAPTAAIQKLLDALITNL